MALVATAILNNGVIMKPYIVKQITDRYNVVLNSTKPEILSTAISSETADAIKKYMVDTVKNGTGKSARISGISVAGKTGSAENEKGEETHSWFVAFAPAEKPQIAVAVIVENAGKGGGRAAEIAREMIKAYLK
jgi:peptidoglycan glycosyltransferase